MTRNRQAGQQIPLSGRIVAVADVFDALTHDRPYKNAWPLERALAELANAPSRRPAGEPDEHLEPATAAGSRARRAVGALSFTRSE